MSADLQLSRRGFAGGLALLALSRKASLAQGFAGLGSDGGGFAAVVPGRTLTFPADHGPHPEYRIEWWYVTANLMDSSGASYGAQWTLFRQAMAPGAQQEGWANQQIWMGHAAVTSADTHRYSETFARGGVGQAGVEAKPFRAWIDSWEMRGLDGMSDTTIAPLDLKASGAGFQLCAASRRRPAAACCKATPATAGSRSADRRRIISASRISGRRESSRSTTSPCKSQDKHGWIGSGAASRWRRIRPDGTGSRCICRSGEKLMLFRLRQTDGQNYFSGNWIGTDGTSAQIASADIIMTPTASTEIENRKVPTQWSIAIASRGLKIETTPLNARSWMGTSFPYWEGPISFRGSHSGVGYLEMTGY